MAPGPRLVAHSVPRLAPLARVRMRAAVKAGLHHHTGLTIGGGGGAATAGRVAGVIPAEAGRGVD